MFTSIVDTKEYDRYYQGYSGFGAYRFRYSCSFERCGKVKARSSGRDFLKVLGLRSRFLRRAHARYEVYGLQIMDLS